MPTRSKKKQPSGKNATASSGIVSAAIQDIELTAEQTKEGVAKLVSRLSGGPSPGKPRTPGSNAQKATTGLKTARKRVIKKP
jgi:hypothetical protein